MSECATEMADAASCNSGAPTRWRLLKEGVIDVGLQPFPLSYEAEAAGRRPRPLSHVIPEWQFTSVKVDWRWATANRATVRAFLRALAKGQATMQSEADVAVKRRRNSGRRPSSRVVRSTTPARCASSRPTCRGRPVTQEELMQGQLANAAVASDRQEASAPDQYGLAAAVCRSCAPCVQEIADLRFVRLTGGL